MDGLAGLAAVLARPSPCGPSTGRPARAASRQLSRLLTVDRDSLPRDYMTRPELLAAYLHYFLPWNVYRQGRLLAGLDLDLAPGARIVDLGAGPLTFLLALWLAAPGCANANCTTRRSTAPSRRCGRAREIFAALAGPAGDRWRVSTRRGAAGGRPARPADLLVVANMINELEAERGGRRRGPDVDNQERLMMGWERMLAPGGRLLLIEPGVRPSAAQLVRLRGAAVERGWTIVAPCTHAETCPVPGRRGGSWCHFACDTAGAPRWLESLGRAARLPKERASLSFLLLQAGNAAPTAAAEGPLGLRVVSDAFDLPGGRRGCYACGSRGLVLLAVPARRGAGLPASGDRLSVAWPEAAERDPKTRATIIPLD